MDINRRATPIYQFVIAVLVSMIFVGLSVQNRLYWLIRPVNSITTPFRMPLVDLRDRLDQNIAMIKGIPYQYRQILDLQRKNDQLAVVAVKVKDLEQENQTLRDTLKSPVAVNHKLLPARVLSVARNAIIDQGSDDGAKVGQAIISGDVYLGKITATNPRSSRVQLVNDPDTDMPAITLGGTLGTVNAKNGQLSINQILQKDTLKAEEPVYTRGTENIPAKLLIGTIKTIDDNVANVYKSATISTNNSITDQSVVLVVLE